MPDPLMKFEVIGPTGDKTSVDDQYILQNLTQLGYQPQGLSADGMRVTLADDQGTYEVPIQEAVKSGLGWQVQGVAPLNADYSAVSPEWRAMMTTLPDDLSKQAYLEGQLRKLGHSEINIVGGGRDWYAYNPEDNRWIGLTNSPDWDTSDGAEAVLLGGRALASGGGALLGAMAGGAGAIPGAAAGGALFDVAARGTMAAMDPVYRDVAKDNLGGMARDVAIGAAIDAGGMALGRMIPASAWKSPVSTLTQKVGGFAEEAGRGVQKAAEFMGKPLSSEVASTLAAPDAGAVTLGLQAPRELVTAAPRAAGAIAESNLGKKLLGEQFRQKMLNWSQGMLKPRAPQATWAEEMASAVQGGASKSYQPGAREVLGNLADRFRPQGPSLTGKPLSSSFADTLDGAGKYIDMFGMTGEALQRPITGLTQGVFKGTGAAARGVSAGGAAMQRMGTLGRPLEAPLAASTGYQAYSNGLSEEQQALEERRRRKQYGSDLFVPGPRRSRDVPTHD